MHEVGRLQGRHPLWKMRMLESHGILDMSSRGPYNSCLLRLTDRGERFAGLLTKMAELLE